MPPGGTRYVNPVRAPVFPASTLAGERPVPGGQDTPECWSSSHFSASRAAMQPEPAAVMA
jgi:hypothetical protein